MKYIISNKVNGTSEVRLVSAAGRQIKDDKRNKIKQERWWFQVSVEPSWDVILSWRPPPRSFCKLDLVLDTNVTGVLKERSWCFWWARLKWRFFSGTALHLAFTSDLICSVLTQGEHPPKEMRLWFHEHGAESWRILPETETAQRRSLGGQNLTEVHAHIVTVSTANRRTLRHTDWTFCWPLKPWWTHNFGVRV